MTQITIYVSAGGRALASNEYQILVQQKPQGDAPLLASNLWCVLTVLYIWLLSVLEHLSYH